MTRELSPNIAAWGMRKELLRFQGSNCKECKTLHMPQRTICPDCGHNANTPKKEDEPTSSNVVEGQSGQTDIKT